MDEKSREVKVMKKTLFAYELISKQPSEGGAAYFVRSTKVVPLILLEMYTVS